MFISCLTDYKNMMHLKLGKNCYHNTNTCSWILINPMNNTVQPN